MNDLLFMLRRTAVDATVDATERLSLDANRIRCNLQRTLDFRFKNSPIISTLVHYCHHTFASLIILK